MGKIINRAAFGCIVIIIAVMAAAAGIAVTLWVAAYYTNPVVFLIAGATASILFFILASKILLKSVKNFKGKKYRIVAYSVGTVVLVSFGLSILLPLPDVRKAPAAVEGQQFWNMPSGLKISYVRAKGRGEANLPPVIFVHGGPGVPDLKGDSKFFGQLAEDGYDVYVYDQIGSGGSSRLIDPRDYTVQRDVEDLEVIRQKIGAEKVILIGHSYGGEIAAHYMASYGSHVEKVIFSSPGAINPKDNSGGNLSARLTSKERMGLFNALLYPRVMMTYGLLQVNPLAAIEFAGDEEMDARFDVVYKHTQPAIHSSGLHLGPELSGLGFYANQTPQSASARLKPDIRTAISEMKTPALIIKGSSDYLSWSSAIDYKKALTKSSIVYLSKAGHNVYQDKPELFMEIMRAFLQNRPLPVEPYTKLEVPEDYEGVH